MHNSSVITQTQKWIATVVVGCNFCPFAARELKNNTIYYCVDSATEPGNILTTMAAEFTRLDNEPAIETSFIILPEGFKSFNKYLELVDLSEKLLKDLNYEGVYQVASFHPQYRFAGTKADDPANYTNRSPYPMLHILREEKVEQALAHYPQPETIPQRNIAFAQQKGLAYMKQLWEDCFK